MLLRRFTDYILKGRVQAVGTAFTCGFIPLLGTAGILIAAFITLRKGIQEGFVVLVAATLPLLIECIGSVPEPNTAVSFFDITVIMVTSNVLIWLFAAVLRKYSSWGLILQFGALLGIVLVFVVHLVRPDVLTWWQAKLSGYFSDTLQMMRQISPEEVDAQKNTVAKYVEILGPYATGWVAVILIFNSQLQLFLARWWQAAIFNPGGFRKELFDIRMSRAAAFIFIITLALSYSENAVILDIMPILYITFGLAGLSLLHSVFASNKLAWLWLSLIYIVVILVPISMALISMIALLDVGFDFRKRLRRQS